MCVCGFEWSQLCAAHCNDSQSEVIQNQSGFDGSMVYPGEKSCLCVCVRLYVVVRVYKWVHLSTLLCTPPASHCPNGLTKSVFRCIQHLYSKAFIPWVKKYKKCINVIWIRIFYKKIYKNYVWLFWKAFLLKKKKKISFTYRKCEIFP